MPKRILAASDTHCGHFSGLTPPMYWLPIDGSKPQVAALQRELWNWYANTLTAAGPFDAALWLGDLIDGRGERSGSTELLEVDRITQCEMAVECLKEAKAPVNVLAKGTPYHTGQAEDFEDLIAQELPGSTIGGHEWAEANGVVFDLKHKVGGSSIPHGRHTAVAKERLWNMLWAEKGYAPRADVILRGHVHYHAHCGGHDWLAMTLPALQGPGSTYGVRQCSGTVDFGFVSFEIQDDGGYTWTE